MDDYYLPRIYIRNPIVPSLEANHPIRLASELLSNGNLFSPIRRRSFVRQFMVIRSNFPRSPIKQRRNKFNLTPWNLVNSVRGLKCRPRLELRRAFATLTPVYGLTF